MFQKRVTIPWVQWTRDCPEFVGKIVLRERIVWFQRSDGIREAPKENSAWFLWERSPLRVRRQPVILYAPAVLRDYGQP